MKTFHTYLRELVEDIVYLLKKMNRNEYNLSFDQYMEEFYQSIIMANNCKDIEALKMKLSKRGEAHYFIMFDEVWKQIYKDLVFNSKGFSTNHPQDDQRSDYIMLELVNVMNNQNQTNPYSITNFSQDELTLQQLPYENLRFKEQQQGFLVEKDDVFEFRASSESAQSSPNKLFLTTENQQYDRKQITTNNQNLKNALNIEMFQKQIEMLNKDDQSMKQLQHRNDNRRISFSNQSFMD